MESLSGEWVETPPGLKVGTRSVLLCTDQVQPHFVDQAMSSQLILEQDLEQMLTLSHQH